MIKRAVGGRGLAHAAVGERRLDRIAAASAPALLAPGQVVDDGVQAVPANPGRLLRHELVAFLEEPLDAARAAVTQLREEVPHLALDRAGALWVGHPGQGARQIAGVDPVPRAVEERRSRALDAARDRLVGRVAVVIDVLAVEVLGARLRHPEAAEPEPRQEGRGDTHPSPGEPVHHGGLLRAAR